MKIPIDQIIISKDNPRQSFDEEGLRSLGESIKTHGLLQPIIVRPKGSFYELVVGDRRLRACALIGLDSIEANVQDLDDISAYELRLIENIQREDLSDAEKGDAVLALWANFDKYETLADVAREINVNYETARAWTNQSRKLSSQIRERVASHALTDEHARELMKYPHSTQEKLADIIIKRGISSHKEVLRRFTKLYDENPNTNLNELADKVLGIETVTIPKSELTDDQKQVLEERKLLEKARPQKIRKEPSKPITKEEAKERFGRASDFKFTRTKVSIGSGDAPPLKQEIKPTIIPIPPQPDYSLCRCALCSLFGKSCRGRCWQ